MPRESLSLLSVGPSYEGLGYDEEREGCLLYVGPSFPLWASLGCLERDRGRSYFFPLRAGGWDLDWLPPLGVGAVCTAPWQRRRRRVHRGGRGGDASNCGVVTSGLERVGSDWLEQ